MKIIYKVFSWLFGALFSDIYLKSRLNKNKEDPLRVKERKGLYSGGSSQNKEHIWLHGASIGEIRSLLEIVRYLQKHYPQYDILITSITLSSYEVLKPHLTSNIKHAYLPLDVRKYVSRFLDFWNIKIAIFVESEIWPNFILATYKKNIPHIIINARMSNKSFQNWRRFTKFANDIFESLSAVTTQNKKYTNMFSKLGCKNVTEVGNIKYDAAKLEYDHDQFSKISKLLLGKKLWLCASTHPYEEIELLGPHLKLKQSNSEAVMIIAPRHVERVDEIMSQISKYNEELRSKFLRVTKYSDISFSDNNNRDNFDYDIILLDSYGEMGLFFELCEIIFIGGTIAKIGGHNPIEPALFKKTILFGTEYSNFDDIFEEFLENDAAIKICDIENEFSKKLLELFEDDEMRSFYGNNAFNLVDHKKGAIAKNIKIIKRYLN